jgi:hypothetical protein
MDQFTMTADEIYALRKEMKHKDKVIDDLIEMLGKSADKYKIQLYEKDVKIEELNDELRITRSENVLLSGMLQHGKVEKDVDEKQDEDHELCDSCQEIATRKHDGWELCDKCYLRAKYDE